MKALVCSKHGMPNTLQIKDIESPSLGANDVLIQVAACSVNFPDTLIIQNKYQFKPELPFSPGSEVSGIITEIGENVKHLQAGQRVVALCGWGGMAEYIAVTKSRVFPLPASMDYVMGASLMYNFGTSFHALADRAKLMKGETLLVLGASGGVGLAAVQLGKIMGATVIAAASSDEKLAICKENGADFLINYETEDLKETIKTITEGRGVNVAYDAVGDRFAEPAIRAMAWGGRYLVVGFAAGQIPSIPLNLALLKGCAIMGVFWGAFAEKQASSNFQNIQQICDWYAEGKLKVHIHKQYTLNDSAQAIQDMMDRKVSGKAIVVCSEELLKDKLEIIKQENSTFKSVFNSIDEIKNAIGKDIGESEWIRVSQTMIQGFADATLDHQWIHIDEAKARQTPFKSTIVHGFFSLSLSVHLLEQVYAIENTLMGINYGTDKVRFIQPVKSGYKIKIKAKLIEVADMPNNGLKMKIEATYLSNQNEKPVCIAELLSVVYF